MSASAATATVTRVTAFMNAWFVVETSVVMGSKRVRAVRAYGEKELEQELVCRAAFCVAGAAVLPAYLAELARPERQQRGPALVAERWGKRTFRVVVPHAGEPPARELIVGRRIHAERGGRRVDLLAAAPDEFGARHQPTVNRASQRPV